jgi:hypothetical protein
VEGVVVRLAWTALALEVESLGSEELLGVFALSSLRWDVMKTQSMPQLRLLRSFHSYMKHSWSGILQNWESLTAALRHLSRGKASRE